MDSDKENLDEAGIICPPPRLLNGDPKRRASDSRRGDLTQTWRTVHAWLLLKQDELLVVEGAEDYDIVRADAATAVQVKDRPGASVSLGHADAVKALGNFWALKTGNPGRDIRFHFATTAPAGAEQNGFGGRKGIELWNSAAQSENWDEVQSTVKKIRSFLLARQDLFDNLRMFLDDSPPEDVWIYLIKPFLWLPEQQNFASIQDSVVEFLMKAHRNTSMPKEQARNVAKLLYSTLDEATASPVPRSFNAADLTLLIENSDSITFTRKHLISDISSMIAPLLEKMLPIEANFTTENRFNPPRMPLPQYQRTGVAGKIKSLLKPGCVINLFAATGTGKSTLARTAIEERDGIVWIELRQSRNLQSVLAVAARTIENASTVPCVVIDDFNLEDIPRNLERAIENLVEATRRMKGVVLVIGYREIDDQAAARIGMAGLRRFQVPPLKLFEIASVLRAFDCPENRIDPISTGILWTTDGHPQLVDAYVRSLSAAQFPKTADQLMHAHADARESVTDHAERLIRELPDNARQLLQRLSVTLGPFRRTFALEIARMGPEISASGEAFGILLGPWLEQLSLGCYRVSPLVADVGPRHLAPGRMLELHRHIARAYTAQEAIGADEVVAALVHGFKADEAAPVALALQLLGTLQDIIREHLAFELAWILDYDQPFSKSAPQALFRWLQMTVAILCSPLRSKDIAALARAEAEADDGQDHTVQALWGAVLLARTGDSGLTAKGYAFVIRYLVMLGNIEKREGKAVLLLPEISGRSIPSVLGWLFARLLKSIHSAEDLDALVHGLDGLAGDDRNILLRLLPHDDGVWFEAILQARQTGGRRSEILASLRNTHAAARRWGADWLARSTAAHLAGEMAEQNWQSAEAEAVLERASAEFGRSRIMDDVMATILADSKRIDAALDIWRRILDGWDSEAARLNAPMNAFVHAGLAASQKGIWSEAAEYTKRAADIAITIGDSSVATALLTDAADALWRAGKRRDAVELAEQAVERAEKLGPDRASAGSPRPVWNALGSILMLMETEGLSILPFGISSGWRDVPVPKSGSPQVPYDWVVYGLFAAAMAAGHEDIAERVSQRLCNSDIPRWKIVGIAYQMAKAVSAGRIGRLFQLAIQFALNVGIDDKSPREPDGPFPAPARLVDSDAFHIHVVLPLQAALLNGLASGSTFQDFLDETAAIDTSCIPAAAPFLEAAHSMILHENEERWIERLTTYGFWWEKRFAAALVIERPDLGPRYMVLAHLTIVLSALRERPFAVLPMAAFVDRVQRFWSEFAKLNGGGIAGTPQQQAVAALCNEQAADLSICAKIALAILDIFKIGMAEETRQALIDFSQSDEYGVDAVKAE